MDYAAETTALLAKWLTDADRALIEARVRKAAFSFQQEDEVARDVSCALTRTARAMERQGRDLCQWLLRGFRELDDGHFDRIRVPQAAWNADPAEVLAQTRALVEARAVELEEMWAEDGVEPWQAEVLALARKWNAVSAHTLHDYSVAVVEAAEEAVRSELDDILDAGDEGRSVARQARDASTKWMISWRKQN